MTPQTKTILQNTLDAAVKAGEKIVGIKVIEAGTVETDLTPTPVAPPPVPPAPQPQPSPAPVVKRIVQDKNAWAHQIALGDTAPHTFENETISDGGFVNHLGTGPLVVNNCGNEPGNHAGGGHYFVMLWPSPLHGEPQAAVSKCVINATGRTIYQSQNEATIRGKCDDFTMSGGTLKPHLKADGTPVKPTVEVRHGKSWTFNDMDFDHGYVEVGQQKTAQPDGSSKYETSQQVGTVTFNRCKFPYKLCDRKPGVQHIVYVNCVGPDGKTFSKTV